MTGKVLVGAVPKRARQRAPLAVVQSPTLATIIAEVNIPSDNTWAEILTKRLAARGGRTGTTARGAARIESFASDVGSGVKLENGSGLSRLDVSSASDVVSLLGAMNSAGDALTYRRSLPLACSEGTVADRMCGSAADHNCRAKTGTLRDVSTLSGYCNAHGHRLAFSILMNDVTDFNASYRHQDRMAALIARYRP